MNELKKIIQEVYKKNKRNKFTFLTGAGISAESGIPTYRDNDGIWVKGTKYYKPEEFGTLSHFMRNQEEVWQYTLVLKKIKDNAKPNKSHFIIAELEQILGDRFHLITQNVDSLHNRSGNQKMYEIHGNFREVICAGKCQYIKPIPEILKGKELKEELTSAELKALKCTECGEWIRPNVLWFDEVYNEKTHKIYSALKIAKNTGILFVIGTSGATTLPLRIAGSVLKYGGYIIDINTKDNAFTDLIKNKKRKLIIRAKSSDILPEIKQLILNEFPNA